MPTLKNILRNIFYQSGLLALIHRWRNRDTLTVLMFHRVLPRDDFDYNLAEQEFTISTDGFEKILHFTKKHYNTISLNQLHNARYNNQALPPRSLLITFDDGWRDTIVFAAPQLKKENLPAVLFVSTQAITSDTQEWWQDVLATILRNNELKQRLENLITCSDIKDKHQNKWYSAYFGNMQKEERDEFFKINFPEIINKIKSRQMLSKEDLMPNSFNNITLGGHGHTHTPLSMSVNGKQDLKISYQEIEKLNKNSRSMSFPHGDWNEKLFKQAQSIGFDFIFDSRPKLRKTKTLNKNISPIGRVHIPENQWTCVDGVISPSKMATFLFFREIEG